MEIILHDGQVLQCDFVSFDHENQKAHLTWYEPSIKSNKSEIINISDINYINPY